ncbi:alpha-1,2-fucosyltransferase [Pontibacter sp. H259]|uniref:alpha-1,2-fucosyltransferase n=1 Tax=Pontibacter sp. H259 TaxID=3133421 RepID=UPI0030C2E0EC
MIYTKLISGLGNQLFQYAIARHISIIKGVPLKLDLSFYSSQNLRSFKLDHYNIEATVASEDEINRIINFHESNTWYDKFKKKMEFLLPPEKRMSFMKEREWWVFEPQIFEATKNTYLNGYWQHYKYFENLSTQIFKELTLKEQFDYNSNSELKNIFSEDSSAVSIHIRRGDYITDGNANKLMGVLPLEYYFKAISYINETVSSPNYFIFSDDLDWAKENLNIKAPVTLVDLDGGKKDYVEIDAMSKCKHNIIANSSFSWWGAFLNQNPNKIVISPSQWVLPKNINSRIQLQFPSWIKL